MDSFIIPAFIVIFGLLVCIGFAIIICVGLPLVIVAVVIGILLTPCMVLVCGMKEFFNEVLKRCGIK